MLFRGTHVDCVPQLAIELTNSWELTICDQMRQICVFSLGSAQNHETSEEKFTVDCVNSSSIGCFLFGDTSRHKHRSIFLGI